MPVIANPKYTAFLLSAKFLVPLSMGEIDGWHVNAKLFIEPISNKSLMLKDFN